MLDALNAEQRRKLFDIINYDYKQSVKNKQPIMNMITEARKLYRGDKFGNEVKGRSQLVTKEVAKMIEWTIPNITEPFLSTDKPIDVDLPTKSKNKYIIKRYLNTHFTSSFDRS